MPKRHGFNHQMAESLAFGSPFNPTARDSHLAAQIQAGSLELAPNPKWKIPAELTWRENPFKEPNWVAQFHMMRWLDPLRRRADAGEVSYIDTWLRFAESWIESNPPGRGRANYSWADMVEAGRALTFAFALPALSTHRASHVPGIIESLRQHGEWLADPSHIRVGNHALQQHQGLLVIGAVLDNEQWVSTAVARAAQMLETAYDDEGMNEEGSIQYHQINFMWWNTLAKRIEIVTGDVPPAFERIRRAPIAMAHATRPDGRYELIGDTEEFFPRSLDHPAIEWVSSGGTAGTPPFDRTALYHSGYVFGRSTWGATPDESFADASFYSLRFGPQNRIHGHVDGMSMTLWNNRESLLIDSGKYAYDHSDVYRQHLLSRSAHNSVSIDGLDYDRTSHVELKNSESHDNSDFYAFHDHGYADATIERLLLISLRFGIAVIVDSFDSAKDVTAHQWWHLNPTASHRVDDAGLLVRSKSNDMYFSWPDGSPEPTVTKGTMNPPQGWFSPSWRKIEPTRVVNFATRAQSGRVITAISFGRAAAPTRVKITDDSRTSLTLLLEQTSGNSFTTFMSAASSVLIPGAHNVQDIKTLMS